MKVLKSEEQKDGKVLVTLELTPRQNSFIQSVGIAVLIQQGAMAFVPDGDIEDGDTHPFDDVQEKGPIPPTDASS